RERREDGHARFRARGPRQPASQGRASHAGTGGTDRPKPSPACGARRRAGSLRAPRRRRFGQQHRRRGDQAARAAEEAVSDGEVRYSREGAVATVIFDRPAARNAMTWRMYRQLAEICARIAGEPGLRVAVLRGAGGKAFIAGTDIAQFSAFRSAEDGLAYEAKMEAYIGGLEALPVPTLAVIEGFAIGGGLAIAAACDLRIATPVSRFGVPIARTLGNCLSMANCARLVAAFGASRAKRILLLAENLSAEEALAAGFLAVIVSTGVLGGRVAALTRRLTHHVPHLIRLT